MKKLFIFMFVLAMSFISCDKDDDQDPLVGTWEYKETETDYVYSLVFNFKSDHTGVIISTEKYGSDPVETESINFSWTASNNTLNLEMLGETTSFVYSISGNKLTLSEDGETAIFTRK